MLGRCSCGERIRTNDLWVMSPTSYHCSTPRCFDDAKVVLFLLRRKFYRHFLHFLHFLSFFAPFLPEIAPKTYLFAIPTKQKGEECNMIALLALRLRSY